MIYPNPTDGAIRIISGREPITKIDVYDFAGRKIIPETTILKRSVQVNLDDCRNGIYLVRINDRYMKKIAVLQK